MASKSYPRAGYNSGAITELEHERLVHAQAPDGLIGTPADANLVYADGTGTRVVKIRAGRRALVRGSQYDSGDTDIAMPSLTANGSGQPRIDLIVLRLDRSDYSITEAVITGTPAANPTAPSPLADTGSTGSFDLPVAAVRVESGATTIAADKVTNKAWYVGDDGQLLCLDSNSRPPHALDREVWETSTSRKLLSDGTNWHVHYDDAGAVTVTLSASISATRNVLRRRNGCAFCALTFNRPGANTAAGASLTVGIIPDGYRPAFAFDSTAVTVGPAGVATVSVSTAGVIAVRPLSGLNAGETCVINLPPWPVAS